jgi:hypothetical protein
MHDVIQHHVQQLLQIGVHCHVHVVVLVRVRRGCFGKRKIRRVDWCIARAP